VSELNKKGVAVTKTVLQDTYEIDDDTTNIFAYKQPKKTTICGATRSHWLQSTCNI